jgi:hypothetical protein
MDITRQYEEFEVVLPLPAIIQISFTNLSSLEQNSRPSFTISMEKGFFLLNIHHLLTYMKNEGRQRHVHFAPLWSALRSTMPPCCPDLAGHIVQF